jgi:hypothetical protein
MRHRLCARIAFAFDCPAAMPCTPITMRSIASLIVLSLLSYLWLLLQALRLEHVIATYVDFALLALADGVVLSYSSFGETAAQVYNAKLN